MGGDNKHLYSFVGSHMLSCDLGVSLWLHLVNGKHFLVVISLVNTS